MKFNEEEILNEIREYVESTYQGHYSKEDKEAIQTFELIMSGANPEWHRGLGFAIGNVLKYADRYGYKNGFNRQDILKAIHYCMLTLYAHDKTFFPRIEDENIEEDYKDTRKFRNNRTDIKDNPRK